MSMTETPPDLSAEGRRPARQRGLTPIVPRATVAGRALVAVVAIMTFLAGITVGSVLGIRATAQAWRSDIAREVTIQIRAGDPASVDQQVKAAVDIATQTAGVAGTHVLSTDETSRLLEPWLGTGLDFADLPVPRIIVLRLDASSPPDLVRLKRVLTDRIPTATLDDHRAWSRRLGAMAEGVLVAGLGLLALVTSATILSVVFATRAAVATNRTVVEVLHFVGARDGFIAAQFQRHFLKVGAQGGAIGGGAAALLFLAISFLPGLATGMEPDAPSVLTWLQPGLWGYAGILLAVLLASGVTALTSRITVYRTLRMIQ